MRFPNALLLLAALTTAATAAISQTAPAWTATPSIPIEREDLTFESSGTRLSGTLYFPHVDRCVPTMIVLHGASSPSRDLLLYHHLVQMLPPIGIAVFIFDRRGSGASPTGGKDPLDFDVLADDAVAASKMLAHHPHVDPARIGYWGVSQGGWLALAAAARNFETAFAISVSAPMTTPDVQMNFAIASILRIRGYSQKDVDEAVSARRANDDYLRGNLDLASAQRALDAVRSRPWFNLVYMGEKLEDPATSSWLKQMRFDPMPILDRVKAPLLIVYGQDDPWVPVELSRQRLASSAVRHPNVEAAVIEAADHTMMLSVDPKDQIDPEFFPKESPNAPAYFARLAAWLTQHGFAHTPID